MYVNCICSLLELVIRDICTTARGTLHVLIVVLMLDWGGHSLMCG